MDKNDSMNKMNDQKSKVSFPVRFVCIVIIIIGVILGVDKSLEAKERARFDWEVLIKATEKATTEEEKNNTYNAVNDWLNSTNPIFDGVTSDQRQVLIDWKNNYELRQ